MKRSAAITAGAAFATGIHPVAGAARATGGRVAPWFRDVRRQLHLDSHFAGFSEVFRDFDAEAAADMYRDAGVQMVSYFAKCWGGYSYYPTDIGLVHPGLDRDYTGEFTRALKKRGIRTIVYFMMATERHLHREHPDWIYRNSSKWSDGDEYKDVEIMCFNTPYVDVSSLPQMKEIIERYDVDGFFVDIVMQQFLSWNCHCPFCRRDFDRDIGGGIPLSDDDPRAFAYRKWSNARMEAFMERIHGELSAVKRDIAIINNYAWVARYPVSPPPFAPHVTWDTPPPAVGNYSWNMSVEARYLSSMPDVPFSMMNTRGNNWMEYSLREREAFLQECAILLASGGGTYLSDIPYPSGKPDPAVYEVFGDVNRRTAALEPVIAGCTQTPEVAVLHSADSVWSKAPLLPSPNWTFDPPYHAMTGAHKALTELHVQMNILNSRTLVERLGDYRALVLSDQRILGPDEAEAVRRFVRDGGALVATCETGTRDLDNSPLGDFVLADVLGVRLRGGPETANCYLRGDTSLAPWGIPAMDIQAGGGYTRVEATTADVLLEIVPPWEGIATGTPPPARRTDGPGVTINTFGRGKAVYIAPDLFTAYFRTATPVMRKLAGWALDLVLPPDSRSVLLGNAPVSVEMFLAQRGGDRFVHLVNYGCDKRDTGTPQTQNFPVLHGITVALRTVSRPRSVTLVPEGREVSFTWRGGVTRFEALPLDIHHVYHVAV